MSITLPNTVRWLRRATLLYLGLPVAIFFWGWLRTPLAVVCSAVLVGLVRQMGWGKEDGETDADAPRRLTVRPYALWLGGILPAAALVLMSGAGGWGAGDSDWFKHDTVLHDLVTRAWPVTYGTSRGPLLLVYYTAFYLPAALLGKWTGNDLVAGQTLAATMFVGILLSLAWLYVLGRRGEGDGGARGWWQACALFYGFAGMDVLGKGAVNLALGLPAGHGDWSDIEWWAQAFQYSSNAAALFWAPQHAFGAWLPTALVLEAAFFPVRDRSPVTTGGLPLTLALFWAPFAALGLAPFVIFWGRVGKEGGHPEPGWKSGLNHFLTRANLASAVLAAPVILYYAARSAAFAVPPVADVVPGRSPMPLLEGHPGWWWSVFAGFVTLEFGVLSLALAGSLAGARDGIATRERRLLVIASLALLGLPTVHYGYANDLVMRGGLPALWTLQVLVLRRFRGQNPHSSCPTRRWPGFVCALVLTIGACNAGLEYRRHVRRMWLAGSWRDPARTGQASGLPASLFELQHTLYNRPGFDFARQYLGSPDSFYGRRLAPQAPSPPQPVAE